MTVPHGALYRLETLGTLSLTGPATAIRAADQRQQRRRLALLSTLACTGDRGLSRDQLLLLFWPDSPQKKARHSLDQLLYAIRDTVDDGLFAGINPIRLNADVITSDVGAFTDALREGHFSRAVALYRGPFLDGFHLSETREFEAWVDLQRDRLARSYSDALETLAREATASGQYRAAVSWQRKLADADPVSTRYALDLMRALMLAGDRTAAIAHGTQYRRGYASELGTGGINAIDALLAELRTTAQSFELPTLSPAAVSDVDSAPVAKPAVRRARVASPMRVSAVLLAAVTVVAVALVGVAVTSREVTPSPVRRARASTTNVAAFDLYQRGIDPALLRSDSASLVGLRFLERAVALDSTFASAYAGLATIYQRMAMSNRTSFSHVELERLARGAAQRAVALDDSSAEAHATLGLIESFWGGDVARAEYELRRALELDPTLPHTREYLASTLLTLGRNDEALAQARLGAAEHPLSPTARATVAQVLYVMGRCDEAMSTLDSLSSLTPPLLRTSITRSLCLTMLGRPADAVDAIRAQATGHQDLRSLGVLGFSLANNGAHADARQIHAELRNAAVKSPWVFYYAAMISAALGDDVGAAGEMKSAARSTAVPHELLSPRFTGLRAGVQRTAARLP